MSQIQPPPARAPEGASAFVVSLLRSVYLIFERVRKLDFGGVKVSNGTGAPESVVVGNVGDLFIRTDGGASTTLYVKESGSGNTGWAAK